MTKRILPPILLSFVLSAAALVAAPRRLAPDNLATISFPEIDTLTLLNGDDGFFVDVPSDAVRVVINLTSSPSESQIDLFVRFDSEPVRGPDRSVIADYSSTDLGGQERIEITAQSSPPLQGGRYFIAAQAEAGTDPTFSFLLATIEVGRNTEGLITVARADFEDGPQGFALNRPDPDPQIPLHAPGNEGSSVTAPVVVRNENRVLVLKGVGRDAIVVPSSFLGNLEALGQRARFEFDLKHRPDDGFAKNQVQVKILGESSAFGWRGGIPKTKFVHYTMPLDGSAWTRLGGGASFEEVRRALQRIEIVGSFGSGEGKTTLDNFELLGEVQIPAVPVGSDFEVSEEGWTHNFPGAPFLIPRIPGATLGELRANGEFGRSTPGGNPGGFLKIRDFDEKLRDFLVAPSKFLGNLAALGPNARFEFDRLHQSAVAAIRPIEVRVYGYGATYRYRGSLPAPGWAHYVVPLDPLRWTVLGGSFTFEETLRSVQRIEVSVDEAMGLETSGLDNFQLLSSAPIVPTFSIAPAELFFFAVEGQPSPVGQTVDVISDAEPVQWTATPTAPWIQLSQRAGTATADMPSTIVVTVNPAGLGIGEQPPQAIAIRARGSSAPPRVIRVRLAIVSATTPRMFSGGVVSNASFIPSGSPGGEISGGMFAAIFGESFAGDTIQVSTVPFPVTLGSTSVMFDNLPAPMVAVSPGQLVVVVPQGVAGPAVEVVVRRGSEAGPAQSVPVAPIRPGLFSQSANGSGPGAIQNILNSGGVQLNTFQTPARPNQAVTIFGTAFGPTQTPVPDGFASSGANRILAPAQIMIGPQMVEPLFFGLSPNSPHLYQANAVIPRNAQTGCSVPVKAIIDGVESNIVTIAITANGSPCQ